MIPPIVYVYQDSQIKRRSMYKSNTTCILKLHVCYLLYSPLQIMGIKEKKTVKFLNPTIKPPNQTQKAESLKWYDFKSPKFNFKLTKL